MHPRDARTYSYDDSYYASGQVPQQSGEYVNQNTPYHQGNYDGSNQYYMPAQPSGNSAEGIYLRGMTATTIPSNHRYTGAGRDTRYYQPQGVAASSSASQQAYATQQSHFYPNQHMSPSDNRIHSPSQSSQSRFIPTPSAIAHNYSNYSHQIGVSPSPTLPPEQYGSNGLDFPQHLVSSHGVRVATGRPRTASGTASTSPTSPVPLSGERFPCDKCGKTFSRSHDRKRHHETQHLPSPVVHRCRYCEKEFSRADSLKRHLDNGCDEMP